MKWYSFAPYLKSLLLPPGFNITLMLFGAVLRIWFRKLGKFLIIIGFVTLYLFSTPFFAYNIVNLLQTKYPLLTAPFPKSSPHQAIVVLGGGNTIAVEYGGKLRVADYTMHRLNYAAYLAQQTHLPVIVSGGDRETELMANYLSQYFKISVLFRETQSRTTAEESQFLPPLLQKYHIKRIYLVTNAWHMPRSVYAFRCAGIDIIPAPMGYFSYGPGFALISFLPNMTALNVSGVSMHEGIGLIWYYLKLHRLCVSRV